MKAGYFSLITLLSVLVAVPAGAAEVVAFADSFNRADLGSDWQVEPNNGSVTIAGFPPDGRLQLSNFGGSITRAIIVATGTTLTDATLSFYFDNGPEERSNNDTRVYLRYLDALNFYYVAIQEDNYQAPARQKVILGKFIGGAETLLFVQDNQLLSPGRYQFSVIGNQLNFTNVSGGSDINLSVADNELGQAGNAGFVVNEETTYIDDVRLSRIIPPIYPSASSPQLAGNEFWVNVRVGDSSNPVSHLFGASFVLNYTQTAHVDVVAPYPSSIKPGAFMGNDVIFHQTVDEAAGRVTIGVSRKNGQGEVSGNGVIAKVKFVTSTSIPNGASIKFTLTEVTANDSAGAPIALEPRLKWVKVNYSNVTVWPGDANNDGMVDQADVLPIGLYWNATGPVRPGASMNWTGQICPPWVPLNAAYVDGTGDGKVDQADLLPIGVNWGNSHTASFLATEHTDRASSPVGPFIRPEPSLSVLAPGQEFFLQIKIEEVQELFGLALQLAHDRPELIQILSVEPETLLGEDAVFYSYIDQTTGKVAIGISRKAGEGGVTGSGAVIRLSARISDDATPGTTIQVACERVVASDAGGDPLDLSPHSANISIMGTTSIAEESVAAAITDFRLEQNYPNPFNAGTVIRYEVPRSDLISVRIFNEAGREVRTLVNSVHPSGNHQVHWDGMDAQGLPAPSGVYFYRLQAGSFSQTGKMVMLR